MTREEAAKILKSGEIVAITCDMKDYTEALDMAIKSMEQEPCEDRLAIERYQDLVDFFCDKYIAKEVLEDRENFKKWLDRIKQHIYKADELTRELDQLRESYKVEVEMNVKLQRQLDRATAPEYEYRMARSFTPRAYKSRDDIDEYLAAGYEFVSASEPIQPQQGEPGYIEYILRRKKANSNE